MFPFWEVAVAPVLEAAEAHRLVEIGALRGENTRLMIDRLGPRTELHVIDPLPDFDPAVHEREFGGQYVFHRDLSVNVLGDLPPMDAALVDGDHNWYTVYNELRLLREVARAHDAPLPVLLLHDVGWPYGRRDLYYDPENIPEEFRRHWKRAGMVPGKVRLVPYGAGLNPTLANAKVEGGRRNGVLTGLDDFVAVHDRPMRVVVLPIYFGLAIAVETERLERQPALAAELDRLESPEGKQQLLELSEDIRIESLMFQHRIFFDREASTSRLAHKYLDQVQAGPLGDGAPKGLLDQLERCLDAVRADYVLGDVVALGVGHPGAAVFLGAYLDAYEMRARRVWVGPGAGRADVPVGWDQLGLSSEGRADLGDRSARPDQIALVHIGFAPLEVALDDVLARLTHGAQVVVDEAAGAEVVAAVAAHGDLDEVELDGVGAIRRWQRTRGGVQATSGGADGAQPPVAT